MSNLKRKIHIAFNAALAIGIICFVYEHVSRNSNSPQSVNSDTTRGLMPDGSEYLYHETDIKKVGWIEKGKDTVKSRLKDSDSAKFRNLYFMKRGDFPPLVCGSVNAKNSFGAYIGYKNFITANTAEFTFLESEMKQGEFRKSWKQLCEK